MSLAVTRAMGDKNFKSDAKKAKYKKDPRRGVTSLPEVFRTAVNEVSHIVMCSDGVWDVYNNQAVSRRATQIATANKNPAKYLVERAEQRVVKLKQGTEIIVDLQGNYYDLFIKVFFFT